MQAKLKKIHDTYVTLNREALMKAQDRADQVDTRNLNLGEGERKELLAATEYSSIDEAIASAVVVAKMKRGALIKVGCLLYFCNKYGVMICITPAKTPLGGFNAIWGPGIAFAGGPKILERLGVTYQYNFSVKENIFDYSQCEIEKPELPISVAA